MSYAHHKPIMQEAGVPKAEYGKLNGKGLWTWVGLLVGVIRTSFMEEEGLFSRALSDKWDLGRQ